MNTKKQNDTLFLLSTIAFVLLAALAIAGLAKLLCI